MNLGRSTSTERTYFRIGPDSDAMAVVRGAEVRAEAFRAAMNKLKVDLGATDIWTRDHSCFVGATFAGDPPLGWRQHHNSSYCVPNQRTTAGKQIAQVIAALPRGVDGWTLTDMFSKALGVDCLAWVEGNCAMFTVYQQHGDVYVLSAATDLNLKPEGCTELKMSEYWAIREAAEKLAGRAA